MSGDSVVSDAIPRLEVRNASKTFGPALALSGAAFTVAPAEVHALVGQNGSGKSTLVKVLTGYHQPDPGAEVLVDGRALSFPLRWSQASAAGISVVHQDLGLLDELNVAENICIGVSIQNRFTRLIKTRAQAEVARQVLDRLESDIDPNVLVGTLNAPQRAVVAIARALRSQTPGSGLLILDESTRALGRKDRRSFHATLRRVVDQGTSVLMVSHDLEEVLEVADRVTVLRDGLVVGTGLSAATLGPRDIARLMLGADNEEVTPVNHEVDDREAGATPFQITGLSGKVVRDLSFTVRPGEIVGITGMPGSGFEEIPAILSGAQHGSGRLSGPNDFRIELTKQNVRRGIANGVLMVPERRIRDGLSIGVNVIDNLALVRPMRRRDQWFRPVQADRSAAWEAIKNLGIRPADPSKLISQMSGGNQQKVLLAKWMGANPRLMVLHEPTQAVDVGARTDILKLVQRMAASGVAVVLVTIEPADLTSVANRIYVYREPDRLDEVAVTTTDEVFNLIYAETISQS